MKNAIEPATGAEPLATSALGSGVEATLTDSETPRIGRYRWVICALLFTATTINYIDRQVLGVLAPTLQQEIGWSEAEYGNIVIAFQMAYAIGFLVVGGLIDRYGVRLGFAVAIVLWSFAGMGHALARSALGFSVARFALGLGEAANFPAAIKTVAEWFPRKERALATGIFNAGSNLGPIIVPLTVPWITINYGWQWAFIISGALGFVWLLFWLPAYRRPEEHPRVSPAELAHIRSDPPEATTKVPWAGLLRYRQTWAFAAGKFLTDPVWWFYLYWLAKFLDKSFGIKLTQLSLPLIAVYLLADVGSVGGGWLSGTLIKRGWTVNRGRKATMLLCALAVVPVAFASQVQSLWSAVLLIGLAAAAHQGWSANLYTIASDMFPRRAVGSVVGIGSMAGALGGMTFTYIASRLLQQNERLYLPIFIICGSAYLTALLVIHLLAPRLEPARIDDANAS